MEKMAHSVSFKTSKNGRVNRKFSIFNFQFSISGVLIFFIIVLASFLRLYRIEDYMTFLGDEGRDVLVVYGILHGKFTLLGPTASVGGFFLGPIYYYFLTPFLWLFNYNPVGPAVMVGLFGVATVFLVYKIGSEFFNRSVGLIAAILYAISPLIIAYSRSSWNPNLMPFFSLSTLYVLYKALSKNNAKLFLLCGFLLGISMQLHYLAILLGVIIAVYVFMTRQSKTIGVLKNDLYIMIGFLVGWSPFLAFEIRHGFPNIQSIVSFIFNPGDVIVKKNFLEIVYDVFFRLFARLVVNFPPPEQISLQAHFPIAIWYILTLILAVFSVLILISQLIRSLRACHPEFISGSVSRRMLNQVQHDKSRFRKMSLLIIWLIVGIGLFGFYKKPIYDYYFGFMFPLPFILVGIFLSSLYKTRIGKIVSIVIFVGLIWINLRGIPFLSPANRQLAQVEEISKFVINKTETRPFNFALITRGNSDHGYRYFFSLWEKQPVTIENPQKDPQRKTVTNQLLVVCEIFPCRPLGDSLWEVAGFGRAEIVGEWDVSVVKVFKLRHYKGKE